MSSTQFLTDTLQKMITLHKGLLQLAERKTDIVKKGDIESLNPLLQNEQKYIKAIQMFDGKLHEHVSAATSKQSATLSDIVAHLDERDKLQIVQLKEELNEVIEELKYKNDLNQKLIKQSLHFVNLSLDLYMPKQNQVNYKNPQLKTQKPPGTERRSFFDSQA